jgi:hypothetical protein
VILQSGLGAVVGRRRRVEKSRVWARIGEFVDRFSPSPQPSPAGRGGVVGHIRLEKPILWYEKVAGTSVGIGIIIGAVIGAFTENVGLWIEVGSIRAKTA